MTINFLITEKGYKNIVFDVDETSYGYENVYHNYKMNQVILNSYVLTLADTIEGYHRRGSFELNDIPMNRYLGILFETFMVPKFKNLFKLYHFHYVNKKLSNTIKEIKGFDSIKDIVENRKTCPCCNTKFIDNINTSHIISGYCIKCKSHYYGRELLNDLKS